ncbi:nicotinate-nucleotide adenylyltransferase [Malacoplasma penetrans]|uniref:Probable nicotinate-nucleotide adenylyltransferase n=1 Tax=Malacoplasma penetrans (strain HF-2) TaxID=272633 RepID=Q8EVP0_MALP2|nr:nicotinate-nucleotide adenylyltransferase [Malacoplasma penetrans]RXY96512.1 nicotinate-nucleotide adenylyltransferase [Malacoplasma penetrans]BAC44310.1 putative nucleotidyl transferase [Malacoplasma penetrans HF-2]
MKKIIIFGGTFDPIHKGHIEIAKKAIKKVKADRLFFVPCNQHPDSKDISASKQERLDMINLSIQNMPEFEICEFELNNDQPSFTINTIRYFKEQYSNCLIYLLIGYDQLINFKTWHNYQEILDYVNIISHVRKVNKEELEKVDFPFIKIGNKNIDAASRELKINPNRKYLNDKVINYINENCVYAYDRLKLVMSEYRLNHCIETANIAKEIALKHKLYPLVKKAYVAGYYHDYAKEFDKDKQIKIAKKLKIKKYPSWKVLHGPVATYYMEKYFLIDDYQIITAIKNHTVPQDFSTLTKIIFIADKIAPRDDEAKKIRKDWTKTAFKDIDKCFKDIIDFYEGFYQNNIVK